MLVDRPRVVTSRHPLIPITLEPYAIVCTLANSAVSILSVSSSSYQFLDGLCWSGGPDS